MWSGGKKTVDVPKFSSRAEAFAFMLDRQLSEGVEPMRAAQSADAFADIFAKNMQLPERVEPEPKGVDKALATIDKVSIWIDAHPKVVEMVIPTLTFVAGLFAAKPATVPPPPPIEQPPIDFENVK